MNGRVLLSRRATDGQSILLIALSMVALIGFVGLALDGGMAFMLRRQMQNAADAAALAGAREVVLKSAEATIYTRIHEYAVTRNGAASFAATYYTSAPTTNNLSGSGTVPGGATGVCVTTKSDLTTLFVALLGFRAVHVEAHGCAAAQAAPCANGYTIWANSRTCNKTINWTGGSWRVTGNVRSNRDLDVSGTGNQIFGSCEVATQVNQPGKITYTPASPNPIVVAPTSIYPVSYNLADYQPGGRAALLAGSQYYYKSGAYSFSSSDPDGLYYIAGTSTSHISSLAGRHSLTVVTPGTIGWSAGGSIVTPFVDGLFLFSTSGSGSCGSGTPAINLSASSDTITGIVYAPGGYLQISGSNNTGLNGSFIADSIRLSGSGVQLTYNSTICSGPLSTGSIKLVR